MLPRVARRAAAAALALLAGVAPAAPASAAAPNVLTVAPPSGLVWGGTAVTITGRGFTGVTSVRFGSQDALEVRIDSDTADVDQLTAFSPPWVPGTAKVVPVQVVVGTDVSPEAASFTYVTGGFAETASMAIRRRGQGATLLDDGTVLVDTSPPDYSGGSHSSEIFDPGGPGRPASWRPTGALAAPFRSGHTSTKLPDGRVLVAGGLVSSGGPSTEIYDPAATSAYGGVTVRGAWSRGPAMTVNRSQHGAVLLTNGRVLVVGGELDSGAASVSAEIFDPSAGTWTSTGTLQQARFDHTTTVLGDGRVLVAGGQEGHGGMTQASAEIFDPGTGRWTATGSLLTARSGHRAVRLSDGRVLVVGGGGANGQVLGSAEVFDPGTGVWSPAGVLAVGRIGHSATLLGDGRVLVAGGRAAGATSDFPSDPGIDSAEVYDPQSNRWAPTSALSGARTDHSATLLPSGQVLVAGGRDGTTGSAPYEVHELTSAELFDPSFRPAPTITRLDPPGGPEAGGTTVRILGSHLFGGHRAGDPPAYVTVRFGAAPAASVRAVSDREVVAVSPPGRGPADVTVTTDLGTSQRTGASQFIYGKGAWSPAAPCPTGAPCMGRADQTSVMLDPPSCHGTAPPPGYPCGRVLVAGKTSRTFSDGVVPVGGTLLTSDTAGFTAADQGQSLEVPGSLPNSIVAVVDAKTVQLAQPMYASSGFEAAVTRTGGQLYDPQADRWSAVATMTNRHEDQLPKLTFASTLLPDGRVLVTGGCCNPASRQLPLASAEIYDPSADRWSPTAPMATGRTGHTATLLDGPACHGTAPPPPACGKVLVAGGMTMITNGSRPRAITSGAELFDPAQGSWSPAPPMGEVRAAHTATLLPDGDVLVVGGSGALDGRVPVDEVPLFSAERFDLETGTWRATPDLPAQERTVLHTATLLNPPSCANGRAPAGYPCGSVLVTGGATNFDAVFYGATEGRQSIKLYDPVTNVWKGVPGLALARTGHTATALPDGSVLVAGGSPPGRTAELYDPATGSSRLTVPLGESRTDHAAMLLDAQPCGVRCGQVLVVGGRPPASTVPSFPAPLTSSELFSLPTGFGFQSLTPARVLDSRPAPNRVGPYGSPWAAGESREVAVTGVGGVPAGAEAVVVNVTVTDTTGAGFLTIWPAGTARPLASSLNWAPGRTVPNAITVKVGDGGKVSVLSVAGAADVIFDVVGFYASSTGDGFSSLPPGRILDSRPAPSQVGPYATAWGAAETREVTVTGVGGVPVGAGAVVLNVTVTGTTGTGFLTVWPAGQARPLASSLNWAPGQTVPNSVTVKVGDAGKVLVFNQTGAAQVIVDVVGFFSASSGQLFHPLSPTRIQDSRPGASQVGPYRAPWAAGEAREVQVTGSGGLPAGAGAALLNVTVTGTTGVSYLTVWPAGQPAPLASSLNWAPGQTIANAVPAKLGATGAISVGNAAGNVDVIADATGWYG